MVVGNTMGRMADSPPETGNYVQAKQFRVPASLVRTHLLDLLANGRRTFDIGRSDEGHEQVRQMLLLGGRYARRPDGSLDSSGSTSDDLTLARELVSLVPWRVDELRDTRDMQKWAQWASDVLTRVEEEIPLEEFPDKDKRFVQEELLPLLRTISSQPLDEPGE